MVSDGVMDAIQSGIITGSKKNFHPSKVILTFLLGSEELYKFARTLKNEHGIRVALRSRFYGYAEL